MAIKQYRCIIVDDDEIDRLTTLSFVKKYPLLALAGIYSNAVEAYDATVDNLPDIAFLDVDMPGMSGLALRKRLTDIPACIFITSYSDYAVESFELAALDYIVKPIKAERFAKTVERIQHFFITKEKAHLLDHTLGTDSIIIKDGLYHKKIHLHQVLYLEALKDYTSIVTTSGKHCVLSSIGNLLKETSFQSFVRIHKSYAVQKHFIEKIKGQEVFFQNTSLPIGRAYKDALEAFK